MSPLKMTADERRATISLSAIMGLRMIGLPVCDQPQRRHPRADWHRYGYLWTISSHLPDFIWCII